MIMKKSMFLLGIATVALASCTNEEVVEMPQNRAIGFSTFVNNSTRALTELTDAENSFTKFYVFGSYGSASTWTSVFTNTEVKGGKVDGTSKWTPTNAAYWEPSQSYLFAAYSNGNGSTTADFDEVTNTLTISNYDVLTQQKDLIAALGSHTTDADVSNEDPIDLSFKHMLSQVKFTFNNTDSHDYTMKISDIKIANSVTTATGTYTTAGVGAWNGDATGTYTFADLDDIAAQNPENTRDLFVIPQDNENLVVTFTATLFDSSHSEESPNAIGTFKGSLKYTKNTVDGTEDNKWTAGFKYNYTATINGSDLHDPDDPDNPDKDPKPIEFTVSAVGEWLSADDTTLNPEDTTNE